MKFRLMGTKKHNKIVYLCYLDIFFLGDQTNLVVIKKKKKSLMLDEIINYV